MRQLRWMAAAPIAILLALVGLAPLARAQEQDSTWEQAVVSLSMRDPATGQVARRGTAFHVRRRNVLHRRPRHETTCWGRVGSIYGTDTGITGTHSLWRVAFIVDRQSCLCS